MFLGNDLVYIPGFREQLSMPGTFFINNFTSNEIQDAKQSSSEFEVSLAGKWASKEAFIKAWSQMYFGKQAPISEENFKLADIQVVKDVYNRPSFMFSQVISKYLKGYSVQLSISHEHDYAFSTVIIYDNSK